MRNHALSTMFAALSLFVCVGCATTESGSVFRGQEPCGECQSCQNGGYGGSYGGGYVGGGCPGGCQDGSCYGGMCGDDCYGDCRGGCMGGRMRGLCRFPDKWAGSNVHHYNSSMVPQCNVGTGMPMMVQYPYYATKGPDCFFYCGD
ncbi:hypothetical protein [Symmachiella dynata]|jgi:hypothetical protein|uniref:Uncharacterized protein n=1 Tax=Symmachiella dynata TaxID=2527995 RepID=A0A517ZLI4_9PLAN|nr:hypothetical protein [Symmachiella dynata]QDT47756.1 hypothetical protein Pan258_17920 [Symmachiella dynata]QDU43351.1 hypothetical protein Mal52_18230 [Symmachiella dynata]